MKSKVVKVFIYLASLVTFGTLFFIIGFILIKGLPHLKPALFSLTYTTSNVSLLRALLTTVWFNVIDRDTYWRFHRFLFS